jgi:MoxR-like ATPase
VTGIFFFNQKEQEFEFRPGPILSQIVLADEINRATPRTQSALLEAMQERQVTVDVETVALPRPFLVIATQNPIELEGTFPLPEAQIDRFLVKIAIGYPSNEDENAILLRFQLGDPLDTLKPVTGAEEIVAMQEKVRQTRVEASVRQYVVDIARATREHEDVDVGVRKYLAPFVLTHRIIVNPKTRLRGRTQADVITDIVDTISVPVESI